MRLVGSLTSKRLQKWGNVEIFIYINLFRECWMWKDGRKEIMSRGRHKMTNVSQLNGYSMPIRTSLVSALNRSPDMNWIKVIYKSISGLKWCTLGEYESVLCIEVEGAKFVIGHFRVLLHSSVSLQSITPMGSFVQSFTPSLLITLHPFFFIRSLPI